MPNESEIQREQLLSAYLDGELSESECATAESLLRDHPEYASMLEEWKSNRQALHELPRYELDDSFTDRVLAKIESGKVQTEDSVSPAVATTSSGVSTSGWVSLAALAAMLLLTLFVFPTFESDAPIANKEVVTNTDDEDTASQHTPTKPLIDSGMLHAKAKGSESTNVDAANAMVPSSSTFSGIRQLIRITSDENGLQDLEEVLRKNKIEISSQSFETTGDAGFDAVYVVATALQMKKAVVEISDISGATVQAVSLQPQTLSQSLNGSTASAQQLFPTKLSSKTDTTGDSISNDGNSGGRSADVSVEDLEEFEKLDRWFGLSDEESQAELGSYLLLINR